MSGSAKNGAQGRQPVMERGVKMVLMFLRRGVMSCCKVVRVLGLVAGGGVLLQTAGCSTTLAPLVLSLLENVVLSQVSALLDGAAF